MKLGSIFAAFLSLTFVGSAIAGGPLDFSYTSSGGPYSIPQFPNSDDPTQGVTLIPLVVPTLPGNGLINTLELVLNGISHTEAADLDITLFHPTGTSALEIMTDRGVAGTISDADLVFTDSAGSLPPAIGNILSGSYRPEGTGGFQGTFQGEVGAGTWYLLIIDDASADVGSIDSYTLRGTAIPEPMTLSLLAFGGLAMIRRRF